MGRPSVEVLLAGDGEVATLMRSLFASATESTHKLQVLLGAVETWSSCLKNAFSILFNSCSPMFLVWECDATPGGAGEHILFYNDAFFSLVKETQLLMSFGQPVKGIWAERSPIQQDVEQVFMTGRALRREQQPFSRYWNGNGKDNASGYIDRDTYNWAYSAIWNETDHIRGVFATICRTAAGEVCFQNGQLLSQQTLQTPGSQTPILQTALRQTEAALQESEARFESFMKHSPTSAWIANREGRLLYLSPTYFKTFDFPQQDAVGKQIYDIYPEKFAQQFLENNHRVFETGKVIETVETAPRSDGSTGSFLVYKFPIPQASGEMLLGGVAIDITERKRIEELLQRRQEELRLITNALPALIAYVDEHHYYRFNNQTYETWFGEPALNFTGKHVREVLGEAAYAKVRPHMEQALSGQRVSFESQMPYREGGTRYIMADYVPHFNGEGKVEGYFSLVSDISERKQAEAERERLLQELAAERARFEAVLRQMPEGVIIADAASEKIILANERTSQILQYSFELNDELESYDRATPFHAYYPNGQTYASSEYPLVRSLRTGEIVNHEEIELRYADGHQIVIEASSSPIFDSQGQISSAIVVIQEITNRKQTEAALRQSEERLRLAMAGAQMGTWDVNLLTGEAIWSEQHFTMLGYEPVATGKASEEMWINRIHPDDLERVSQEWQQSRQEHRSYQAEYRVVRADNGQISWLAAVGSFTYNQNGEVIRSIGVLFDITHRKQTEMALIAQEQRYRYIFEAVNVSIWEEDFSEVKAALDQLKVAGVQDFRQYFIDHPESVQQAISMVHLRDVNQASLQLFGAQTKAELLNSLHQIFTPETREAFLQELLTIAAGETHFAAETVLQNLQGQRLHVWFSITFPASSEPYDRVLVSLLDITDRKQAEAALRHSEQQLRLAQQAADAGLWNWDIVKNQVTWSEEYYQLYGLDKTIVPSYETWLASIHELDREQADRAAREALEHQANLNVEFRILHSTKGVRWLTAIGQTFYDDHHQPKRMAGIALDITNRKQAEAALKETERRLQLALGAAKMIAWDINLKTNEAICSENARDVWGTNKGTVEEFFSRIHPDDLANVLQISEAAMQGEVPYTLEYRIFSADGDLRWIMSQGSVVQQGIDGKAERIVGVSIDITARKQSEAEREQLLAREQSANETLKRFIEHTPVAVVMLDRDMRYLFASHRWIEEYAPGYTNLKGVSHYEVMTDIPEYWHGVHQRCLAGATERCEEDYYLRKDGSALWLHWEVLPWYASDNEIGGIIIFTENITERKLATQERDRLLEREQAARREAEQANRIKDEFLAVLSHELRSPLNPILGWTKLLQTRQFDEAGTRRALETIERNAKLQTQLIDDLLDVSRILRGKMVLNVSSIDLTTVIDAALETVRLSAEAKGIEIQKVMADDVEPILGDSGRLQQIMWNLLSNAVKFTHNGGQIMIQLEQIGTAAQIQVTDNGKGITPEFLPHVFEYFRQEDGTTTRRFGGLGLGLAIVRYLTELHGGTVKVESPGIGLGATFSVLLPTSNRGNRKKVSEGESPSTVTQPLPLANLRVLVVDDDADMRELIFAILHQAGAQIQVTSSAIEALAALKTFKPNILISDIGMPEVDGYELMRQIRRLSPEQNGELPAIALTAYAGEVDQQQALAAGFQKHIAKPVEPEELVKVIVTLMKPS